MTKPVHSVSVNYAQTGASTRSNEMGMRAMQERAYEKRGEQYLLIKSPPASGKSRALMFIALDKLENQGLKQALIIVPERSIGASFANEPLSEFGFRADWVVNPEWNLCNAPGADDPSRSDGTVKAVGHFLESDDKVLVCTHATFRFAVDQLGIEAFDNRLIAVDEIHHVSADKEGNRLGAHLSNFIMRDKLHLVAMTGSYFRGDAVPVLSPEDETKFETVTYTYYEQLNGYEYLKTLDIGYYFYNGSYLDEIDKVLNPDEKTIVHIPYVNSRESTKRGKTNETTEIMGVLGEWIAKDDVTGFDLIRRADGHILKVADLVDDGPDRHAKVMAALKNPANKNDRDFVDVIIALGMAKEGFNWIWCEHALTIGYRASLTEIVQIIGRATRDAPGKVRARFTNLIVEPDASEENVCEAINDTLKAIAASLLMEQVLAPKFNFTPKTRFSAQQDDFYYGESGYDPEKVNIGLNEKSGQYHIEIKGLAIPESKEAKRICNEGINEVITTFVQDRNTIERGLFDKEIIPEELTQVKMGKIVRDRYPDLSVEDREAVRQHAIAALNLMQKSKAAFNLDDSGESEGNTSLIDGIRKFALSVTELDIDLIDRINPFAGSYAILSKAMNEKNLRKIEVIISAKRMKITPEDAEQYAVKAYDFQKQRGRLPRSDAHDAWERLLAEGARAFLRFRKEGKYEQN
ncbi:MAG: DEAD/DEAH box helicase family protein [Alphaproteobacteria bacterium]|nr:DEAD/DEAH box helicase family protein [Alphaproteobacteria bacterium]